MQVRIYQPSKSTMQSAPSQSCWHMIAVPFHDNRFLENLMNRTSTRNPNNQICLKFYSLENAIKFAESNNYQYEIVRNHPKTFIKKSYGQ